MGIPIIQTARLGSYIFRQRITGTDKYPLVLMLEPLFQCNLRCKGCGKLSLPVEIMNKRMSVQECIGAARECGAPVVSIPGGEPLLHPDIPKIVEGLIADKRFVYLCTNAQLVAKRIDEFEPSTYLNFSIHLDGFAHVHDAGVCKEGVFETSVAAIRELLACGFRVTTNTTFYAGQDPEEAARFFDFLMELGVEGMTVSSAFSYESAADQEGFMTREQSTAFFREVFALGHGKPWRFNHSTLYLEFLAGERGYECTPWGTPTRNVMGWQKPCYLLDDGYVDTYRELIEETDWDSYGASGDERCRNCMVHCGYEPSAVVDAARHPLRALGSRLRFRNGWN